MSRQNKGLCRNRVCRAYVSHHHSSAQGYMRMPARVWVWSSRAVATRRTTDPSADLALWGVVALIAAIGGWRRSLSHCAPYGRRIQQTYGRDVRRGGR